MGGGEIFPPRGKQPKGLHPIQPLRPLAPLPKLGHSPTTQRTLPIAGAPRPPSEPAVKNDDAVLKQEVNRGSAHMFHAGNGDSRLVLWRYFNNDLAKLG
jgi:hypothetical protein